MSFALVVQPPSCSDSAALSAGRLRREAAGEALGSRRAGGGSGDQPEEPAAGTTRAPRQGCAAGEENSPAGPAQECEGGSGG